MANLGESLCSRRYRRQAKEALDDEYHARATYDQVIRDFGEAAPQR